MGEEASGPETRNEVDAETKAAITRLERAIDSLAGMVDGCAAYLTALDEARHSDRRKALGVSRQLAAVKARVQDQESQDRRPLARDWQGRPRELNPDLDKPRLNQSGLDKRR